MSGTIYKITNKMNGKSYIGQTTLALSTRWDCHRYRAKEKDATTGLYGAIRKYGIENFICEAICKCKTKELDELEIYYIDKYNTYNDGYNLTLGGQQNKKAKYNEKDIIETYRELQYINETANRLGLGTRCVSRVLHKNNIKINLMPKYFITAEQAALSKRLEQKKPINILELKKKFDSIIECGEWLINNGYSGASTATYAQKGISNALNGKRLSYCGFHFEFI